MTSRLGWLNHVEYDPSLPVWHGCLQLDDQTLEAVIPDPLVGEQPFEQGLSLIRYEQDGNGCALISAMRNVDDILAPELYYRIQPLLDEQASAMLCRWVQLLTLITAGQFQSFVSYWNAHPDALEAFVLMPASYRDHHAYPHGLLQHSLEVAELAYQSARRLGHSATECQLVLLAGLLHDLGKIYSRCATKNPQYRPGPHECFNFALLTEPLQQLAQQDWQAHQLLCSMLAPYQHHRSEQYAVETLFRHADQASCASNRMHGLFAGKPAHYHFVRSGTQMVRRVV